MNNLYERIASALVGIYGASEAHAVSRVFLEDAFGITLSDVYCDKVRHFSSEERCCMQSMIRRLENGEPVQYVVGMARFGELMFNVTPAVLIPRPETLELVQWSVSDLRACSAVSPCSPRILDIGTGSGCIAITLAKSIPAAKVTAIDISTAALAVAQSNVVRNGVHVTFAQCDIFAPQNIAGETFDVIVSNPPYVCRSESAEMHRNVLCYEPHDALFVDDDAPLVFYEAIAEYAAAHLARNGVVYTEINSRFGDETAAVFRRYGFADVRVREDSNGKPRMLKAKMSSDE